MNPTTTELRVAKRHFNALDLSRLVAAVAVLFWHYLHFFVPPQAFAAAPGFREREPLHALFAAFYDHGHLAVEYFWTVSGFVFAHVYLANPAARSRFWIARFARLWPLHLMTLAVVALLQAAYGWRHGHAFVFTPNDWPHLLLNLGLAHYWGFQAGMTFNGPSWSLSVELVAYAAFWALLPALRRRPLELALTVAAAAALVALPFPELKVPACLAYFFLGLAAYAALPRLWSRPELLPAIALAGLAAAALLDPVRALAFPHGGLWVLSLFVLVVWIDRLDVSARLAVGRRLGDASYGTYLWHFPIQLAMVLVLDRLPGGRETASHAAVLAFYLAAALAAGFASHRWLERPAQAAILAAAARRQGRPALA